MPYNNFTEVKMPEWETIPQGIFIPRGHHYNANNKRKKGNENRRTSIEY